ncbi:MAG: hydroxymethylbilane synthase [Pseudomonadota bacterium]
MQSEPIRIGTRGSPLALIQARETRSRLMQALGLDEEAFEIVVITTTGDRIRDRPLSEIGGKGLFTKEIEEALFDRRIDLAVHSAKDMPTVLPDGLGLTAFLPREDVRDAFIGRAAKTLEDLPKGAVVGSSSLRRAALVRSLRPDVDVIQFRGNVETRLKKLEDGVADATLLAYSGLRRMGLSDVVTSLLDPQDFVPAVAQGAICIESRLDDDRTLERVAQINDAETESRVRAERAFLHVLDGSCRTPIAGHARLDSGQMHLDALIVKPDGTLVHRTDRNGSATDGEALGRDAGAELKALAGPDFFTP